MAGCCRVGRKADLVLRGFVFGGWFCTVASGRAGLLQPADAGSCQRAATIRSGRWHFRTPPDLAWSGGGVLARHTWRAAVAWGGKLVWFCGALCLAGGFVLWRLGVSGWGLVWFCGALCLAGGFVLLRLGVSGCCSRLTLVRVSKLPQTAKAGDNTPSRPNLPCTGGGCWPAIRGGLLSRVAVDCCQVGTCFQASKPVAACQSRRRHSRVSTVLNSSVKRRSVSLASCSRPSLVPSAPAAIIRATSNSHSLKTNQIGRASCRERV